MKQQINPGDVVYFRPISNTLRSFEGRRTVKRIERGLYILSCGDIRLEAKRDELSLIEQKKLEK